MSKQHRWRCLRALMPLPNLHDFRGCWQRLHTLDCGPALLVDFQLFKLLSGVGWKFLIHKVLMSTLPFVTVKM